MGDVSKGVMLSFLFLQTVALDIRWGCTPAWNLLAESQAKNACPVGLALLVVRIGGSQI